MFEITKKHLVSSRGVIPYGGEAISSAARSRSNRARLEQRTTCDACETPTKTELATVRGRRQQAPVANRVPPHRKADKKKNPKNFSQRARPADQNPRPPFENPRFGSRLKIGVLQVGVGIGCGGAARDFFIGGIWGCPGQVLGGMVGQGGRAPIFVPARALGAERLSGRL